MSSPAANSDDQFLTEDLTKDDDLFDELDNAAEEELLHFSEDDDFLEELQEGDVEYVDEEGNPVEIQDGEQLEVLESVDLDEGLESKGNEVSSGDLEESFDDRITQGESLDDTVINDIEDDDDDDEEEEEEEEEARRNRFRTERRNIVTITCNKRNMRDIPDSLDSVVLEEEVAKAAEFMNREKERKRGNWRGNRRGTGGTNRMLNRKPPLLSVMPQPQHCAKVEHQQLGVVQGATRLPHPKNFQQLDDFHSAPQNERNYEIQPPIQDTGPPTTPRKILINPHFRGPRPPQSPSQTQLPQHQTGMQYDNQTRSLPETHHTQFTDPSQEPPPQQNYIIPYDQDQSYRHYESPSNSFLAPTPQPQHLQYHPMTPHQESPQPQVPQHGYHDFGPPLPLQRHPPPHPPQFHHHPPQETWNGPPPNQHLHQRLPRPGHHPGPPGQHHHIPHMPPHPIHYEPRYRPPPPMSHGPPPQVPLPDHHHHHPPPIHHGYSDPHHFQNGPPNVPPYPPPPPHQPHFRAPPPNLASNHEYPPPPRMDHFNHPPAHFNENFQDHYGNYLPENQFAENPSDLYKSFDNNEWNKSSFANSVPQNTQQLGQRPASRGFHHQAFRGTKRGFIQRSLVNKRLNASESQAFPVQSSPKQARMEARPMSKNIKEVPITENLTPVTISLPPGKEILPPEDEDEETKDLRRKLEEQKRIREENLRKKEERRRMLATQRMKEINAGMSQPPNQQPKIVKTAEATIKTQVKALPNVGQKLVQTSNTNPNAKKKVVVVRRPQNVSNINEISTTTSVVQKMVLVRGANRGVRGRGRLLNQFSHRMAQNVASTNANIGPRFPKNNQISGQLLRGTNPVLRQAMPFRSPNVFPIRNTNPIRQANLIRQGNPSQVFLQTGNPRLKMVRKVNTVKAPPNRQVIASDTQDKLSLRRVQMLGFENLSPAQHGNTRIVQPPQNQEKSVLINNLSATTTENQLKQLTQGIGAVEIIKLMKDGQAFVTFKQPQHASQFQKKYQRYMLDLSMIQVSMVSPQQLL